MSSSDLGTFHQTPLYPRRLSASGLLMQKPCQQTLTQLQRGSKSENLRLSTASSLSLSRRYEILYHSSQYRTELDQTLSFFL